MKSRKFLPPLSSGLLLPLLFLLPIARASDVPLAPRAAVAVPLADSTVRVRVREEHQNEVITGHGSAFGVDLSAYGIKDRRHLLTAGHLVFENGRMVAGTILIEVPGRGDKTWVRCTVAALDKEHDLCLLQSEVDLPVISELAAAEDKLSVGSPVVVVGCPLGTSPRVSPGAVTSVSSHDYLWRATAAFNHGNSGGPVFDAETNTVIGVAVAGVYGPNGDMDPMVALFAPIGTVRDFLRSATPRLVAQK